MWILARTDWAMLGATWTGYLVFLWLLLHSITVYPEPTLYLP